MMDIRPFLDIRMPTFPLTEQERSDIVEYFRAADRVTGGDQGTLTEADRALISEGEAFVTRNCLSCHYWKGKKPAQQDAPDLANVWKRYRPDGVEVWLRDPQKAYPGTNMPSFFYSEGVATVTDKDGNPSPELAERQIDAIRAFLFSQGPRFTER
jgi:mono/diheme cytochrome c family protein